jgi:hypothetical protein
MKRPTRHTNFEKKSSANIHNDDMAGVGTVHSATSGPSYELKRCSVVVGDRNPLLLELPLRLYRLRKNSRSSLLTAEARSR